jgi:hypothetical protein
MQGKFHGSPGCEIPKSFYICAKFEKPVLVKIMYWTLELASKLEDAPWPASKEELIDYAIRSGAPLEVIENLQEIEDEGDIYESIEDIWPDYPSKDDFFFNEDEY